MPLINGCVGSETVLLWKDGIGIGKGKAIPLQAWTGPEGSMRLRIPDFKTIRT